MFQSGSYHDHNLEKKVQKLNSEVIISDFMWLPALSAVRVTAQVRRDDAGLGAVADLTPHQRVAAKGLRLTLDALGE